VPLRNCKSRSVLEISKKSAYLAGYCDFCAGFFNYKVVNKTKDLDEIRTKIKKAGPPRFLCGATLHDGKKHLCTVAFKYPNTLERWKKEHVMMPGKYVEFVQDTFANKVSGQK